MRFRPDFLGRPKRGFWVKNILVVDDLYSIRRLFWRFLESRDCHVEMAANAVEAIAAFKKYSFDLAFIDVEPKIGMDGIELAKFLRSQKQDLPIVIMSARFEYEEEVRAENFEDFFLKGIDFDLGKIGSYVQKYTGLNPNAKLEKPNAE